MIKKLFTGLLLAATIASSIALAAPEAALDYTKTPNKYVEFGGTRYAYRTIGERGNKPPLVLFQHFTGTMDDWDRRTIEGLAKSRELIISTMPALEGQADRHQTPSPAWRESEKALLTPSD